MISCGGSASATELAHTIVAVAVSPLFEDHNDCKIRIADGVLPCSRLSPAARVPRPVLRTVGEMGVFRALLACVASSVIAGCATLPSYREDAVSTAEIVRHIKCELRDAVWSHPGNEWVRTWKAGLVLTLEVFHTGGVDSDNTWVFPLNQGATFILGVTGGFSGQANRTERISFNESLVALNTDPKLLCLDERTHMNARSGW